MNNVTLNDFLGNFSKPQDKGSDDFTVFLQDKATSTKVPVEELSRTAKSFLDLLASNVLDADDRGTIVMGFPKAGKSYIIEQLAFNIDYYLPKSNLEALHFVYVNDTNLMELGNSQNLRSWVTTLKNRLNINEENLCFVTESVEAAVFFMTTLAKAKVVFEVNFDTFMMILHNNSRSASKMWSSWQIFDVNTPRFSKEEIIELLQQSIITRMNAASSYKLSDDELKSFVDKIEEFYPENFVEIDGKECSIISAGAWAYAVKNLINAGAFVEDEEFLNDEGELSFDKLIEKIALDCETLFNIFLKNITPRDSVDEDDSDEDTESELPREILQLISGDGQRIMMVGEKVKQKEVTPLVFKDISTLDTRLRQSIMGQSKAVEQVSKSLIVPAAGLHDSRKPLKSFLFLGPTGVGKTQLALDLANEVSETPLKLVRIDMSEYQHEHEVAKLFGAPPGYVGFEKGGRLTSAVAEHPHSLVLLDEVEKAHPKIWDSFLQVFDSGHMTDSQGNVIDFTQTIIVMTSNLGVSELTKKSTGFGVTNDSLSAYETRQKDASRIVMNAVEKFFRPEFINRIDEIVMFNELSPEIITAIIRREIGLVKDRAQNRGVELHEPSDAVIATLLQKSDISKYGAREIQRVVSKNISNQVASFMILNPEVKTVDLDTADNEILVH